jgi:hypothetical protein
MNLGDGVVMRQGLLLISLLSLVVYECIATATDPCDRFHGRLALIRRTLHNVTPATEDSKYSYPVVVFTTGVHILPFRNKQTDNGIVISPVLPPASGSQDDDSVFQLGLSLSAAGIFVASANASVLPAAYDQWINKFPKGSAEISAMSDNPAHEDVLVFGGYAPKFIISNYSAVDASAGFIQTHAQTRGLIPPIASKSPQAITSLIVLQSDQFDFGRLMPADDNPTFAVDGVWGLSMNPAVPQELSLVKRLFAANLVPEQTLTIDLINSVMYLGQSISPVSPFSGELIDWVYFPLVNISKVAEEQNSTKPHDEVPVVALRGFTVGREVIFLDKNLSTECESFDPIAPQNGAFLSLDLNSIVIPLSYCDQFSAAFQFYRPDCTIASGTDLTICTNASLGISGFPDLVFVFGEDSLFSVAPENYVIMSSPTSYSEDPSNTDSYVVLKLVCSTNGTWPFTLGVPFLETLVMNIDYNEGAIALFQGDYQLAHPHWPDNSTSTGGDSGTSSPEVASPSGNVSSPLRLLVISGVAVVALGLLVILVSASRRVFQQNQGDLPTLSQQRIVEPEAEEVHYSILQG